MNKMYKLSLKTILNTLPLLATTVHAQNPTVSYATWKDNAKAAYTIVHDDFGDGATSGIAKYADGIAYSRGIKFCFGAITSQCDGNDWSDARRMRGHGHEAINHTHSHRCSYQPGWCASNNIYSSRDFSVELDGSTNLIEQNVGERPRFFIHPYDLSTSQVLDRLKSLGYLGARSGSQGALNNPYFNDFFHLNYFVHDPNSNLYQLNQAVQSAVSSGGYLMRELHGVGDGSWASVPVSDYQSHLDFVKQQMDAGNLWSATASEAITYKMQKDAYQPSVSYDGNAKTLTVNFSGGSSESYLFKTPVTLNIQLNGLNFSGGVTAKQGGENLYANASSSRITVNAYPHKGNIVISAQNAVGCYPNCPPPPPTNCAADGKLKVEVWTGIYTGTKTIQDLKNSSRYPNKPTTTQVLGTGTFSRGDIGRDQYGERVSGYLRPTVTGEYQFAVTGTDDVELYLSSNNQAGQKVKIASFTGATDPQQLTKYGSQKSSKVTLQANQSYYVEVLHMAVAGTNHCALYWTTPNSSTFNLVGNANFSSQSCTSNPSSLAKVTLNGARTGQTALLSWSKSQVDENTDYSVERLESNGRFSEIGTAKNIQFTDETPINGVNVYRVRYTDTYGQTRHSEAVQLNFTENPNLYLFPNPATQVVSVDLREWNQAAVTLYIYDVRGAEVQRILTTASDTPYALDLSAIQQTGQYLVRVQGADGRSAAQRVLIAK
jgi:Polysaccharide deacetylase/PA14 domain/Secretion system C-terminal sorting domain